MSGTFERPRIVRLTEYKPVMTRIPASSASILRRVCTKPVNTPAKAPANIVSPITNGKDQPSTNAQLQPVHANKTATGVKT